MPAHLLEEIVMRGVNPQVDPPSACHSFSEFFALALIVFAQS